MTRIRALLVDDQILVRQGLRKLLELESEVEVVAEAEHGADALHVLDAVAVDVALVDARMPVMDGIELTRRLTEEHSAVAVIILTTFDDDEYIFGGLRAGARGFLLKDTSPEELVGAMRRVADGETVLGGPAAERLVARLRQPKSETPVDLSTLSAREKEVAAHVARGLGNREIARALYITEGTVKNHITAILRKLDLSDRTRLALHMNEARW